MRCPMDEPWLESLDEHDRAVARLLLAGGVSVRGDRENLRAVVRTIGDVARVHWASEARSLAYLRRVLSDLANEVGLPREDISGIVRAVKARDGAGRERTTLRVQVEALQASIERIGKLIGARAGETVEAAVERVMTWQVVRSPESARAVESERTP